MQTSWYEKNKLRGEKNVRCDINARGVKVNPLVHSKRGNFGGTADGKKNSHCQPQGHLKRISTYFVFTVMTFTYVSRYFLMAPLDKNKFSVYCAWLNLTETFMNWQRPSM